MRKVFCGSLVAFGVIAAAGPAQAFDCNKAQTVVEKAICADPELLAADEAMARAYGEVRELSTQAERKMLAAAQKTWIAEREASCAKSTSEETAACVGDETRRRLGLIEGRPESGPGNGSRVIPSFVSQKGGELTYDIDATLMRFAKPAAAGEKAFNAWVEDIAAKLPAGKQEEKSDTQREAFAYMSLNYLSDRLLSARVQYEYYDGGAHPAHNSTAINIDMNSGKELGVEDVMSEEAAATIAAQCYDQIAAEKKERIDDPDYRPETDELLSKEAIAEHVATLSRWSFTANEAAIDFDEYTVGAYAEGAYACTFPMAAFRKLALPTAPLP